MLIFVVAAHCRALRIEGTGESFGEVGRACGKGPKKKKRVRKIRILLVVKCAAVKLVGHLGFSSIPCWWSLGAK